MGGGETLFPLPSEPRLLEHMARDQRFAVHAVRPPRTPARTAAQFEAAAREACPGARSETGEKEEGDFSLSMQQSFVQFFLGHLTPYRSLLLFHKPGAGKTCAAISVALDHLRASPGVGAGRVLLLASGPLQGNFRRQLFDDARFLAGDGVLGQCTRDAYLRIVGASEDQMASRGARDAALRKVSRLIKAQFAMRGYEEFASELERLSDADVAARYSDKVVIVDEAHNLRPSNGDSKRVSVQVARLAALGRNNRLLLLTATPMYDAAREIVYLLNLCRANDGGRPPITRDDPDVVGPASVGYVSYALAANPLVFPALVVDGDLAAYPAAPTSKKFLDFYGERFSRRGHRFRPGFALVTCPMAKEQRNVYTAASAAPHKGQDALDLDDDGAGDGEDGEDAERKRSLLRAVQVANVAFPGSRLAASAGRRGFLACVRGGPWAGGFTYAPSVGAFLAPQALPRWSCKLARLAESLDQVREGPVLAFSDYLYAGVLLLALALEHRGWVRADGPPLLAPSDAEPLAQGGGTPPESESKRKRKLYVLLTGDYRFTPDFATSLAYVNASTGSSDSVVAALVTRVAGEGVDFRGVREVHVLEPWYNASKLAQVVGRAVRACSHAHLPLQQRNVVVRYYAATLPDRESSDLCMYRLSEAKAERIASVEAALRANAVDCALFADADKTVDPALRLDMVDARGAPLQVRPASAAAAAPGAGKRRCRVALAKADAPSNGALPFPDHLVPQAMRELEAALQAKVGRAVPLKDVIPEAPHQAPQMRDVYLDALGRLVAAGRVRFDDGLYLPVPPLSAVARVRHEVLAKAPASPLSPDSPVDLATAYARALSRLADAPSTPHVAYGALRMGRAEAAGAAQRFLVANRASPLSALERKVKQALERAGLILTTSHKAATWIDWAATPPEAWAGKPLRVVPMPDDHVDGLRAAAAAKVAEWTGKRLTFGYLAAPAMRSGAPLAGADASVGAALKLVRFPGQDAARQTGFVCEQTSQFRAQDVTQEIAALERGRAAVGGPAKRDEAKAEGGGRVRRHSKRRLCDALGVALLSAGRLLTPLETVLLGF